MKKILLIISFMLFAATQVFCANYKITGIVKNTIGKPFPFVYVYVKAQPEFKTATELDGTFSLLVADSVKLPFELEFYSTDAQIKTYKVTTKNKSQKITITLETKETKKPQNNLDDTADKPSTSKSKVRPTSIRDKTATGRLDGVEEATEEKGSATTVFTARAKKVDTELSVAKIRDAFSVDDGRGGETKMLFSEEVKMSSEIADEDEIVSLVKPEYALLPPTTENNNISAGMLTAGELNDFTKWTLWEDIAKNQLEIHQKEWKILPTERYVAQLTNPTGMPIVDAKVYLKDSQGNTLWQARTDNTGKAELWAKMLDDGMPNFGKPYTILFSYDGKTTETQAIPFHEKINTAELKVNCTETKQVDITFIVDATGSMGDEIRYLQMELYDVIQKVKESNENIELRTGSIFYRDVEDDYLTRTSPLDKDIDQTINFIKQQNASGGGDYPEAVDAALIEAIENEDWQENSLARIAFLILDAPPHSSKESIERIHRQVRLAAMKGIRIVPLVCSGADKSTEYLMRSIALATNGTYVFLTDESGIGGSHMKPTTDKYEVEKLNHILLRIITQFSAIPSCDNNWAADFDKEINSQEKFLPKPYKEKPETETERLELSDILNIYPNPCDGVLNVELHKPILDLYVVDVTGKALQNFSFDVPQSFSVNLQGYSNGTYFINAFYQGRWYSAKFLLNR